MKFLALVILAYFLGSIPTGLWLGKAWKGIDVRTQGSGNLGATNVFRVLGAGAGIVTLVLDIAKGFLPVYLSKIFLGDPRAEALVGLTAIIGHTTSIFVRFKGGKGVATSAGVFLGLLPVPCTVAIATFAVLLLLSRYVSLSSIFAAFALALTSILTNQPRPFQALACAVAALVLWTHRGNIGRLMSGTESRFGAKKAAT